MKTNYLVRTGLLLVLSVMIASISNAQVGQIIWEENFNELNPELWNTTTGDGCPDLCGWGNEELEYYQPENVSIEEIAGEPGNYALVLEAKEESVGGKSFTSGKISSENNVSVKYGMIEVRMKSPDVEVGLWPAVWLLGTNHNAVGWPQCGEIDMMEMGQKAEFRSNNGFSTTGENEIVGSNLLFYAEDACSDENQTCAASIAFDNYYCTPYKAETPLNDRFVIYRLYWDESEIKFTVEDNGVIHQMYTGPFPIGETSQEFTKPFYFIMNLAVGGNFTDAATAGQVTAPLPGKMFVDYIRIRKWNGKGEVTTPDDIMANAGANIEVEAGEVVSLNASGSYGDIVSYEWTIADSVISTNITDDLSLPSGSYAVKLTVTDNNGKSKSDEIIVKVGNSDIGEIIWEENFDSFNSEVWNYVTGDGCDEGPNMCGWGNAELQYYQSDNVYIEGIPGESGNNALVLEAREETMGSSSFTSGKITTEEKLSIQYGVVEVRMKSPDVEKGLWPAAWMLGINHRSVGWPQCGEIDMMEMGQSDTEIARQGHGGVSQNKYVGANLIWYEAGACAEDNPTCAASIAYDVWYDQPYISSTPLNDRFVIYRTYWGEDEIRLTVEDNGIEYDLYTGPFPIGEPSAAFREPFYFILNLAVGGRFTDILTPDGVTAPLPGKMYVDYVRVRKWKGRGEVISAENSSLANAGADQWVTDNDKDGVEVVTLSASGSYGDIVSYEWSEGGAQIATDENPTIEFSTGNHFITLKTTDVNGNVSTDDVMVEVREIIWEDNFDSFNTDIWNIENGDGCPDLCGWGNAELQYYNEDNVYTEEISAEPGNYALVLEAKSETVGASSFTSGKVSTSENMRIRYGLIEVRMQVPDLETGLWPAAWLLGDNHHEVGWPQCGEIDMMEMGQNTKYRTDKGIPEASENDVVGANLIWYSDDACSGENQSCAASIAYDNYYCNPYNSTTPLNDRFVIYRTYWDDQEIRFTVEDNGKEYDLYTGPFPIIGEAAAFHNPFYFILNLAVGGNFTDATTIGDVTAPLPAKMLVDYVRVMKWNGKGEVSFDTKLVANAGSDILKVDEDGDKSETVVLDGTASTNHAGGEIVSYSWSENGTEIATGETAAITLSRAVHKIYLTVSDAEGNTATDSVLVTIRGAGLAPTAVAGNDTVLYDDNGDDLVTYQFDGSGSYDSNDTIIGYSWILNEVDLATGVNPSVELSTGVHFISLVVTNSDSLTDSDEIIVTVIDPDNVAPLANAGTDQSIEDDNADDLVNVMLDGSASSDSDGTIESYVWTNRDKEIASGITPTFEMSTGVHEIILTITDDDGTQSTDTVVVTIIDPDNVAPVAFAGSDTVLVDENLDNLVNFTFDASESSDSDGVIDSYSWIANDTLLSSEITFSTDLPLGSHSIMLTVTDDDGVSGSITIVVKVNQLPVAVAGEDILITDNNSDETEIVTLDGSASYDPYGTIVAYSWLLGGTEIGTSASLSYDFQVGTNEVTLNVTDDDGFSGTDEVLVVVASLDNIAPIANAGDDINAEQLQLGDKVAVELDASASYDTDGTIYSYTWLNGEDIIATGVNPTAMFDEGEHSITLKVTDNEGAYATDVVNVTIINRINLALNKTTFTSSTENGETTGANAVDGDISTRWSSQFADPQWIYVDLGDIYMIREVVLTWEAAFASAYQIQVSTNAVNWSTVFTETSGDGDVDVIQFSDTSRYIRVLGTTRATVYGYSLFELEVYGSDVSGIHFGTDATLSELMVEGSLVDGFTSSNYNYNYVVNESGVIPEVTAAAADPNADIVITQATDVPGNATVQVISEDGLTTNTYSIAFTLSNTNNLFENSMGNVDVLAYPNPVDDLLNLELSSNTGTIEIRDITGKLIEKINVSSVNQIVNMSDYQPGVYFLSVNNGDYTTPVRVIKK